MATKDAENAFSKGPRPESWKEENGIVTVEMDANRARTKFGVKRDLQWENGEGDDAGYIFLTVSDQYTVDYQVRPDSTDQWASVAALRNAGTDFLVVNRQTSTFRNGKEETKQRTHKDMGREWMIDAQRTVPYFALVFGAYAALFGLGTGWALLWRKHKATGTWWPWLWKKRKEEKKKAQMAQEEKAQEKPVAVTAEEKVKELRELVDPKLFKYAQGKDIAAYKDDELKALVENKTSQEAADDIREQGIAEVMKEIDGFSDYGIAKKEDFVSKAAAEAVKEELKKVLKRKLQRGESLEYVLNKKYYGNFYKKSWYRPVFGVDSPDLTLRDVYLFVLITKTSHYFAFQGENFKFYLLYKTMQMADEAERKSDAIERATKEKAIGAFIYDEVKVWSKITKKNVGKDEKSPFARKRLLFSDINEYFRSRNFIDWYENMDGKRKARKYLSDGDLATTSKLDKWYDSLSMSDDAANVLGIKDSLDKLAVELVGALPYRKEESSYEVKSNEKTKKMEVSNQDVVKEYNDARKNYALLNAVMPELPSDETKLPTDEKIREKFDELVKISNLSELLDKKLGIDKAIIDDNLDAATIAKNKIRLAEIYQKTLKNQRKADPDLDRVKDILHDLSKELNGKIFENSKDIDIKLKKIAVLKELLNKYEEGKLSKDEFKQELDTSDIFKSSIRSYIPGKKTEIDRLVDILKYNLTSETVATVKAQLVEAESAYITMDRASTLLNLVNGYRGEANKAKDVRAISENEFDLWIEKNWKNWETELDMVGVNEDRKNEIKKAVNAKDSFKVEKLLNDMLKSGDIMKNRQAKALLRTYVSEMQEMRVLLTGSFQKTYSDLAGGPAGLYGRLQLTRNYYWIYSVVLMVSMIASFGLTGGLTPLFGAMVGSTVIALAVGKLALDYGISPLIGLLPRSWQNPIRARLPQVLTKGLIGGLQHQYVGRWRPADKGRAFEADEEKQELSGDRTYGLKTKALLMTLVLLFTKGVWDIYIWSLIQPTLATLFASFYLMPYLNGILIILVMVPLRTGARASISSSSSVRPEPAAPPPAFHLHPAPIDHLAHEWTKSGTPNGCLLRTGVLYPPCDRW
jgi:hypothetical protein